MRVGFLCSEYFDFSEQAGKLRPTELHGGYGYLTRMKAEGIAALGHEVHAFIPSAALAAADSQGRTFTVGSVAIHAFPTPDTLETPGLVGKGLRGLRHFVNSRRWRIPGLDQVLRDYPLDIYQSEQPTLASCNARLYSKNQVVVFQDPWGKDDLRILADAEREYMAAAGLSSLASSRSTGAYDRIMLAASRRFTKALVASLPKSQIFGEAHFISDKARGLYGLEFTPEFLPNPIDVPAALPKKSASPTVAWIARWDIQKRIDTALAVARATPEIDFNFVGTPTHRPELIRASEALRRKYSPFKNIHLFDFVSEDRKREILENSWILLNTSVREGLPITFLEAGAYGLSIVSAVDPDGWATRFGSRVQSGDYQGALREAVRNEDYRTHGRAAYEHVRRVHEKNTVVRRHIEVYDRILAGS